MTKLGAGVLLAAVLAASRASAQGVSTVYGAYNGAAPTLQPGQVAPLQVDQSGNLRVSIAQNPFGAFQSGNVSVTTAQTVVFPANAVRVRYRLQNTDYVTAKGGGGGAVWCGWGSVVPSPHATGFLLLAGATDDVSGPGTPTASLSCVSETGSLVLYWETY